VQLSLASWSLRDWFRRNVQPLSLLEFPRLARREFGLELVELNSVFFQLDDPDHPGPSPPRRRFLDDLAAAVQQAGVGVACLTIDHHGDLSSLDEAARRQAVAQHAKWIAVCRLLRCPRMRANSGGKGQDPISEAHLAACAKSFAQLAGAAGREGVTVLMENHWGVSESAERMVAVLSAVASPHCGALADFRNWPAGTDPIAGLRLIAPFTRYAHAKFLRFDGRGEDPDFDTASAVRTLRSAGFDGPWGIEYEGPADPAEGVRRSQALLSRYLG